MLHLRRCILTRLLSSPPASPIPFPPHRLLSAAAPVVSPNPSFAVEEYLVGSCGLTPAQALKASTKLSKLKPPCNPDAVRAFLTTALGLSGSEVAALVAKDPKFLCARVERTLAHNIVRLTGLGLSHTEIARFVSLAPISFRSRNRKFIASNLPYYLTVFGSFENFLRALKFNTYLLTCNLEKTVKPNIAILRECMLGDSDVAKLSIAVPRMLTNNPEHVRAIVACAKGIGVPCDSKMFRIALHAVAFLNEEKIATKMDCLKKTFGWSDAEVSAAVCKAPMVLTKSEDTLQSKAEFLISEVGLEPAYIAYRLIMLSFSLEGRLRPPYYVVKFLKENGLLDLELHCAHSNVEDLGLKKCIDI